MPAPMDRRWLPTTLGGGCPRERWSTTGEGAAAGVAYGEAQGLDPGWLYEVQRFLPPASLTILLDIAPETAAARKTADRDRYERDLTLLSRVRESYYQQSDERQWVRLDGERPKQ